MSPKKVKNTRSIFSLFYIAQVLKNTTFIHKQNIERETAIDNSVKPPLFKPPTNLSAKPPPFKPSTFMLAFDDNSFLRKNLRSTATYKTNLNENLKDHHNRTTFNFS